MRLVSFLPPEGDASTIGRLPPASPRLGAVIGEDRILDFARADAALREAVDARSRRTSRRAPPATRPPSSRWPPSCRARRSISEAGGHAPRAPPAARLDPRRLRVPPARRDGAPEPGPRDDPGVRRLPRLLLHERARGRRARRAARRRTPPREARLRARGVLRDRKARHEPDARGGRRRDLRLRRHERLLGAGAPDGGDEAQPRPRQGQGLRDRPRARGSSRRTS